MPGEGRTDEVTSVPNSTAVADRPMKPGIYRGRSAADFGLWRLNTYGVWLFCVPVAGEVWKRAGDQNPTDLIMLVDETRL